MEKVLTNYELWQMNRYGFIDNYAENEDPYENGEDERIRMQEQQYEYYEFINNNN